MTSPTSKGTTGKVEAYASQHDAVSRLVTIPGIGALGATAIVAAAGDGRQFRKARDLAAWLGLVPAEHSTGGDLPRVFHPAATGVQGLFTPIGAG